MIDLEQIPDSNIIIVTAKSKITGDDYENILIPAVKATLEDNDKLRFLYILGEDYDGFEGDAMWDDTKLGMKDLNRFEKIGVVSDKKWIRRSIKAFGFLIPGEVKLFTNDELTAAKTWIAA
jgi:hypothetical protein